METSPVARCPRCHRDLVAGSAGGSPAHACLLCGGVWLPGAKSTEVQGRLEPGALRTAAEAAQRASVTRSGAAVARCPACAVEMARVETGTVVIDVCAEHGTWFDRNEMQALAEDLKQRRSSEGSSPAVSAGVAGSVVVAGVLATGAAVGGAAAVGGPQVAGLADSLVSGVGQVVGGIVVEGGAELAAEATFSLLGSLLEGIFS